MQNDFLFVVLDTWSGEVLGEFTGEWEKCVDGVRACHYWQSYEISVYHAVIDPSYPGGGFYELVDYMADELFAAFDAYLLSVICGVDEYAY